MTTTTVYSTSGTNSESRLQLRWPWSRDAASKPPSLVRPRAKRVVRAITPHISKSVLYEEVHAERAGCGSRFVLREANIYRRAWNMVVVVLLLYTATVFPYRLAFVEFKIGREKSSDFDVWDVLENIIDVMWYTDLLLPFFLSFRDEEQYEVTSMPRIAQHYICSSFLLNVAACMPKDVQAAVAKLFGQATALRVSPLLRLVRIARLVKLAAYMSTSSFKRWVQSLRALRAITFLLALMEVVHVTACGLYLCAALNLNPAISWVGLRRVFGDGSGLPDDDRVSLIEAASFEQWLHSMYLTLTVFTTVGLDGFALSLGEVVYTCVMMLVGALVQSVVVSKIMNLVTDADQENLEILKKREIVVRFAQHAQMDQELGEGLGRWLTKTKSVLEGYDQDQMRKLVMFSLPDSIMEKLHGVVFKGRLVQNRLVSVCSRTTQRLPPRFPLLVALGMNMQQINSGEVVYYWSDHPWNLFLVIDGTFAYVARPHPSGGICEILPTAGRRNSSIHSISVDDDDTDETGVYREAPSLCPYLLFGHGSYFGEFEMFVQKSRVSSVRCESAGAVLTISKVDFLRLADEFPDFAEIWKSRALRREGHRKAALKKLKEGRSFRQLAAFTIQKHFRVRVPAAHLRKSMTDCLDNLDSLIQARRHSLNSPTRSRQPTKEPSDPMFQVLRTNSKSPQRSRRSSRETIDLSDVPKSPNKSPQRSRRASHEEIIPVDQAASMYADIEALRWEVRTGQAELMHLLEETLQAVNQRRLELMQAKGSTPATPEAAETAEPKQPPTPAASSVVPRPRPNSNAMLRAAQKARAEALITHDV